MGEKILVNDKKPSRLEMAYSINKKRDEKLTINYKITGNCRKMNVIKKFICCIKESSLILKIKINIISIIFLFDKTRRKDIRDKIKKNFYKIKYEKEIQQIENRYCDYWIFMPLSCLGDLIVFCRNIKAFKRINGGKVVVIVKDKNRQDFVKLFDSVDEVIIMNEKLYIYGLYDNEPVYNPKIEKGKVHLINVDFITKITDKKFDTPRALYRYSLNLPFENIEEENPTFLQSDKESVERIWQKLDLNNKTIFLSPFAASLNYKVLSKNFWTDLADELTDIGYKVIFNADKADFPKHKCLFLPLTQIAIFAGKCYACIAFRSGLADLISLASLKKYYVIYPNSMVHPFLGVEQREIWKKTYNFNPNMSDEENMHRIFSFQSFIGKSSAEEIIFKENEEFLKQQLIEKIKN